MTRTGAPGPFSFLRCMLSHHNRFDILTSHRSVTVGAVGPAAADETTRATLTTTSHLNPPDLSWGYSLHRDYHYTTAPLTMVNVRFFCCLHRASGVGRITPDPRRSASVVH